MTRQQYQSVGPSVPSKRAVRKYCLHENSKDEADSPEDGRSGDDAQQCQASIFGMQEGMGNK